MKAARPWMKFYPQDWRADEKLRLCSLAGRGLWMEMLAIMHRSERYGQLLISGRVPTDAQLAVQVGAPTHEVSALLAELDSAGVFSRAASGAIYSRRMTRDEKKARTARQNGRNGGNPSLLKQTGKQPSDKGEVKAGDKAPLKLRGQKPDSEANASGVPPLDPVKALFDLGVGILTGAGLSDREARSMIGLWRKHHTDAAAMEALLAARDKTDPVAWIQAKLGGQVRAADELIDSIDRKYGT